MPAVIPFIPLIAAAAGPLLSKALGPGGATGGGGGGGGGAAATAKAKPLFTQPQIAQATDKYTSENTAKWNQIIANMGAGGGGQAGSPYGDVPGQIGQQATSLGQALGKLTTESGYGENPMANLDAILRGTESGISPRYALY